MCVFDELLSLVLATLHDSSTSSSSWTGVSEALSAAVKSLTLGYLSAMASSLLALNTCREDSVVWCVSEREMKGE